MYYKTIEEYVEQFSEDIQELIIDTNDYKIKFLPDLSNFQKLIVLRCRNNNLISLPQLPYTLEELDIDNNQLTELPSLPISLNRLYCGNNLITNLPDLPIELRYICCSHNLLTNLPYLPDNLRNLNCSYNQLSNLPTLPINLINLSCINNKLKCLPPLPNKLMTLCCTNNALTCLPDLPYTLLYLYCSGNNFPYWLQNQYTIELTDDVYSKIKTTNRFKELYYLLKFKQKFRALLWEKVREPKIRAKYHPDNLMKMLEEKGEMELDELDEMLERW